MSDASYVYLNVIAAKLKDVQHRRVLSDQLYHNTKPVLLDEAAD